MNEKSTSEWIEECPEIVISRVITDIDDLKFLATTKYLYNTDTLVVVPVKTLKRMLE